eukprot:12958055-Alexandrium_andersonii.AAC.1
MTRQPHPRRDRKTCNADSAPEEATGSGSHACPNQSARSSSMSRKASVGLDMRSARRCRRLSKNPGSIRLMRSASKVDPAPRKFSEKLLVRFINELAGLRS